MPAKKTVSKFFGSRTFIYVLAAIAFVAASFFAARAKLGGIEGFSGDGGKDDTIFVSVAAYRDADCVQTIRDIFQKASDPSRVFVGICEQNSDDNEEDCLPPSLSKYKKNVRRLTIPNTEAKGPTKARALVANVLYGGEKYFMQIDSHTIFVPNWDVIAIEELRKCPDPSKSVLSHYPRSWDEYEKALVPGEGVPVLCKTKLDPGAGVPNLEAVILKPGKKPRRVPFVSGGFVFGPGSMVRDVEMDPTLDYVFVGEEILHAARLFTNGYSIYTPTRNVVTHFYGRDGRPKFWNDLADMKATQEESNSRVRRLLKFEKPYITDYPYGFGNKRTLDEFYKFANINPDTKQLDSASKFCNWNE